MTLFKQNLEEKRATIKVIKEAGKVFDFSIDYPKVPKSITLSMYSATTQSYIKHYIMLIIQQTHKVT